MSHRPILYFILFAITSIASGYSQDRYGLSPEASVQTVTLPEAPADLEKTRSQAEQELAEAKQQTKLWDMTLATLTAAKKSVADVNPASAEDLDEFSRSIGQKNENLQSRLEIVLDPIETIYGYIYPSSGNSYLYSSDPDLTSFYTEWRNKSDNLISKLNISLFLRMTFEENRNGQRAIPPLTSRDIALIRQSSSAESIQQLKKDSVVLLDGLSKEASDNRDRTKRNADTAQTKLNSIVSKLGKTKLEINQLAIELGLPLFCGTVLLMLSIPICAQAFSRAAGSSEQAQAIFASGILVEIITVLLLTMTILILGLSAKIEGPVLGTLLGGISGYVLNRFRGNTRRDHTRLEGRSISEQ